VGKFVNDDVNWTYTVSSSEPITISSGAVWISTEPVTVGTAGTWTTASSTSKYPVGSNARLMSALRAVHRREECETGEIICAECGYLWPCRTAAIMNGGADPASSE
jgi:hypothetical protein